MELSYNNGSTFRGCQKKFYWRYIERLEPVVRLTSLTLGAVLHEGFDLFYKGGSDSEVYQYITDRFNEEISKQEAPDQEDLLIAKYTAMGMWLYYPYKAEKYEKIASEEKFSVPLLPDVNFIGKVDGRIKQGGHWWVRELKTTGLNQRQFEGRCRTSAQGTGYVYGLTKSGYDIKGILYDYIKKPILRKGMTETADEFGRRIMRDYKDRPKMYYAHHYSYRTPVDLHHFEVDTKNLAEDILAKLANGKFYRNMDQCWNFGSECPYSSICFTEVPDSLTLQVYFNRKGGEADGGRVVEGAEEGN
jgi:hypothetical protein